MSDVEIAGTPFVPDQACDAAFLQGYRAWMDELARDENPYEFSGDQAYSTWLMWDNGWWVADWQSRMRVMMMRAAVEIRTLAEQQAMPDGSHEKFLEEMEEVLDGDYE
jgi:hypothetical protein